MKMKTQRKTVRETIRIITNSPSRREKRGN